METITPDMGKWDRGTLCPLGQLVWMVLEPDVIFHPGIPNSLIVAHSDNWFSAYVDTGSSLYLLAKSHDLEVLSSKVKALHEPETFEETLQVLQNIAKGEVLKGTIAPLQMKRVQRHFRVSIVNWEDTKRQMRKTLAAGRIDAPWRLN